MSGKNPTEVTDAVEDIVHAGARDPQWREPCGTPDTRQAEMLDAARRHVVRGKRAIVEQRERVDALRREGHETAEAEIRLSHLEITMRSMQDHVAIDDEARERQQGSAVHPLERAGHDASDAVHRVAVHRPDRRRRE